MLLRICGCPRATPEETELLRELLGGLNMAARRAYALADRANLPHFAMKPAWAKAAGVFAPAFGEAPTEWTTTQEDTIVRYAASLRKTDALAIDTRIAGVHQRLCALTQKIIQKRGLLAKWSMSLGPFQTQKSRDERVAKSKKTQAAINLLEGRKERLLASVARLAAAGESKKYSRVFGGKKLLAQRATMAAAGPKKLEQWESAWDLARNGSWLFLGAKHAAGANKEIKWDPESGTLQIRLTESQAERRMRARAEKLKIPFEIFLADKAMASDRMACRVLRIPLDLSHGKRKHGIDREGLLAAALERDSKPDKSQALPRLQFEHALKPHLLHKQPVSWRISLRPEANSKAKKQSATPAWRIYAQAIWEEEDPPLASSRLRGCLGVDLNFWGAAWALCDAEGNKPSRPSPAATSWKGKLHIDGLCKTASKKNHEMREAAKTLVDMAVANNVPLAVEHLDFSQKKSGLRYATASRARGLSTFAYGAFLNAIRSRATKHGVEVILANAAWTSFIGFAKYCDLGLDEDTAAAFAIARKGILSKKEARPSLGAQFHHESRHGKTIVLASRQETLTSTFERGLALRSPQTNQSTKSPQALSPVASRGAARSSGSPRKPPALRLLFQALGRRSSWRQNRQKLLRLADPSRSLRRRRKPPRPRSVEPHG